MLSLTDKDGMEAIHCAFGKHGNLSEEAFVTEMLTQLESQKQLERNQRVSYRWYPAEPCHWFSLYVELLG